MKKILIIILTIFIFNCLKTESSCKKQSKKEFFENCKNQIISQLVEKPNDNITEIIKQREVRAICLISFLSYEDDKEYCNQPFIYWQNEQ